MADLRLAVRPGADTFLLGALLATIVRSGQVDREFIEKHTVGFAEVRLALLNIPVEEWAATADLPIADPRALRCDGRGREGYGEARTAHADASRGKLRAAGHAVAEHADKRRNSWKMADIPVHAYFPMGRATRAAGRAIVECVVAKLAGEERSS